MRVVSVPGTGECFDLDRPGAVAAWNRALNQRYAMENLSGHSSGFVRRIEARRRRRIAELVPAFEVALDLGAEDGTLAAGWRHKGRRTLLLDLDPRMLHRAPGDRLAADASSIPLRDGACDCIVLSAILEHVVDPADTLRECARVLAPGGSLIAYVPWDGAVVPLKRWAKRLGFPLGKLHDGLAPGHLRTFDRAKLERLFSAVSADARVTLDPLSFGYYITATRVTATRS
ncbi:MAG: class I SAM-dependent methyltransferase [Planctomycetota bacterium]